MKLHSTRKEYTHTPFLREDLKEDPLELFKEWLQAAIDKEEVEPNAMILSTCSEEFPTSRTVLLKEIDSNALLFFTNTESLKAKQIEKNPQVAALFLWLKLSRQVTLNGIATPLSEKQVEAYFQTRPRGAQLGAWASRQDQVIEDRGVLEDAYNQVERQFEGQEIPVPPWWGGYRLEPSEWIFWQGQGNRLHDRFSYSLTENGWKIDRLMP